jgi:hypothetical protein
MRVRQTISRQDAIRLISRAREAVCEREALQDLVERYYASTVFEALLEEYAGVTNGFLSQVCEAISGRRLKVRRARRALALSLLSPTNS